MCNKQSPKHPHDAVIRAWLDGEQIQYRYHSTETWRLLPAKPGVDPVPAFYKGWEYRVAPKTAKGYRRMLFKNDCDDGYHVSLCLSHEEACKPAWWEKRTNFVRWIDKEWQYEEVQAMTVIDFENSWDWREAFNFAHFSTADIAIILKADEGCNDGDPWLAVGILKDGTFFFLSAWCDYTGWDCQSGGSCETADTLDNLIRFHLSDDDRNRLGYILPPETDGAPLSVIED